MNGTTLHWNSQKDIQARCKKLLVSFKGGAPRGVLFGSILSGGISAVALTNEQKAQTKVIQQKAQQVHVGQRHWKEAAGNKCIYTMSSACVRNAEQDTQF